MSVTQADLESGFDKFDKDASGKMDSNELAALCANFNVTLSGSELNDAMSALDSNGSGKIDKSEFVEWWSSGVKGNQKLATVAKGGKNEMLAAKRERQRAEGDVQLLMNRLKHLKMEEERARKKIEETNGRAGEISSLKKRNAEKRAEMDAIQKENDDMRMGGSTQNLERSKRDRQARQRSGEEMLREKRNAAKQLKDGRTNNENALRQQKNAYQAANGAMRDQIRGRRLEVQAQRKAQQDAHEAHLARQKQQQLEQERYATDAANAAIKAMEAEEERLIEKLRATQDKQRKAYEGLEKALKE